jgi:hypothetical protein
MKPREFVSKYKLDENSEKFDRNGFIADFELEFASLLQVGKAKEYLPPPASTMPFAPCG